MATGRWRAGAGVDAIDRSTAGDGRVDNGMTAVADQLL